MSLPASHPLPGPAHQVEPHPYTRAYYPPVRLQRHATPPTGLGYHLTSFWEVRHAGQVQRTTITKELTIHYVPAGPGSARLTYRAAPAVLHKADPSALEKALLLLASLYQHLELEIGPGSQFLALRNPADVLQTWAAVQQELVQRSGGDDALTQYLRQQVEAQLQDPGQLLASLRHDYAFRLLLPDWDGQRLENGLRYAQAQEFPSFFAGTDLWLTTYLELGAPLAAGQAALHLRGTLDAARTDRVAVAQQVDAERVAAGGVAEPPTDPATLRATSEATYHFDLATGWPLGLDISVRCQAAEAYSKEYFLRLQQVPTQ